jgi:hypothetical protein
VEIVRPRDTSPEALAVQTAIYRRMTPTQRCELAVSMSLGARSVALSGIRNRHPDYDEHRARFALFRLLLGDDLFRRAYPDAPLVEP